MIWLLKLLIFGHAHKWEEIGQAQVEGKSISGGYGLLGVRYRCRCTKCGSIRKFDCF